MTDQPEGQPIIVSEVNSPSEKAWGLINNICEDHLPGNIFTTRVARELGNLWMSDSLKDKLRRAGVQNTLSQIALGRVTKAFDIHLDDVGIEARQLLWLAEQAHAQQGRAYIDTETLRDHLQQWWRSSKVFHVVTPESINPRVFNDFVRKQLFHTLGQTCAAIVFEAGSRLTSKLAGRDLPFGLIEPTILNPVLEKPQELFPDKSLGIVFAAGVQNELSRFQSFLGAMDNHLV